MTRSNAQRLMMGCGLAALGAAAVFWVLAMAAANTEPKGPEGPPAPAAASDSAAGDLALDFSAADVASLTYISEGEMLQRYECTDPEAIGRVVDALARLELGEPTELVALDAGDRLVFLLNDGSERRYFFEAGIYVDGDVRRPVDSGGGDLTQALNSVRESSVEGGRNNDAGIWQEGP